MRVEEARVKMMEKLEGGKAREEACRSRSGGGLRWRGLQEGVCKIVRVDDVLGCIAGQVWHTGKLETQGQAQNRRPNVTVTG